MGVDAGAVLGGAAAGAVITSVLQPLVSQRGTRREMRAEVLRRVADVETARWADSSWSEFRRAVVHLRAAGLVAGANRAVVDRYLCLVYVARRQSEAGYEEDWPEESGGIPTALADLVVEAATILAEHMRHPYRGYRPVQRELRMLDAQERALRDDEEGRKWDWTAPRF
jgi:hypothetical protein